MDMKNECFSRQKEKRVSHSMVKNVLLLALLLVSSVAFAQKKVTGVAVDGTTNEPLPFITIQVKGTTTGTTSDMDGKYEITVPDENSILVYSYIGYRTQEIRVGNQSQIMVRLVEDVEALDEVVVVGYGVQNKRDVTGSIAKVGGEELTSVPTSSFDAALQGRAAGVQVTQSSGLAGSGAAIRVRGIASITAGGDPLIVVDGIPIMQNAGDRVGGAQDNPLSSINSNDIESIDILKDASATAIYGSRGANGVVLITTKRGKEGKPQISFSQKVAFSTPNVTPDMLNTREYLEIYDEALRNDYQFNPSGSINPATVTTYPGGFTREQALMNNTDWEDEVTRVGVSSYTDFSISWGNKKIKTYAGISHVAENSYMKEDHFGRTSLRLNVDYNPISILKVGANLSYSHVDHRPVPTGWDGGYGRAISDALPYFPVYNEDGSYYIFPMSTNPITEIYEKRRRIFTDRTMASLYADLQIIKDLSLRVEGNIDYRDNASNFLQTQYLSTQPNSNVTNRYETNWNAKALLNYSLNIGDDHRFHFMVGTEAMKSTRVSNYTNIVFTPGTENWLFKHPAYDEANRTFTRNPNEDYSFISFFGRVNYTLKDRYMFTGTFRRDGSSRFGANNKFGNFPAASVGWLLTEEDFLKDNDVLSLLKLKAGFGITGNAEIPNYAQWGTVSVNTNQLYQGQNYWYINNLQNSDLKWETTSTVDVGLEYGFLRNRISGEIGFYNKYSKDLFLNVSVPASGGYTTFLGNVGKVRNTGVEFNIKSVNITNRDFTWTTDFNISWNKNKVLDVGTAGPDALQGEGDTRVIKGQPIGVNYLVKFLYVDPADGMPVYEQLDDNGNPVGETKEYNADRDRQPVGHPNPDFVGGFNNTFTYKNWDFGLMFTFQIGGNIFDDAEKFQMNNVGTWSLKRNVLDRWQQPGDITDVPRVSLGSSGIELSRNTTEYLHDAGFLRLKNVNVGYTFRGEKLQKWHIRDIRVFAQATNLLTLFSEYYNKYHGEPEIMRDVDSAQKRNLSLNVTYLTAPQARTYTVGLSVNF